jgi:predicted  nucleic acid-binding Zn-ribbon protein
MRLQQLDQELREHEQTLSSLTGRINELRDQTAGSQAEYDQLKAEDQQALLARKELERALAEGEEQIRSKRMRLSLIKNDRELQALGHEVEIQKEHNQQVESELLARMEAGEQRAVRLNELRERIEKQQAELKQNEKDVADQVETLRSDLVKRRMERDKLAEEISPALRQRYEMIFKRRGGLAVVLAKSGTCQGCRMRIPPQLYNELQKNLTIHYCPNCQRILAFEG